VGLVPGLRRLHRRLGDLLAHDLLPALPALRHDFDCRIGKNGWQTSRRFYRIQRAYGVGAMRAGMRFAGVTAAWEGWLRWRRVGEDSGASGQAMRQGWPSW
jgi:hypothetical protein